MLLQLCSISCLVHASMIGSWRFDCVLRLWSFLPYFVRCACVQAVAGMRDWTASARLLARQLPCAGVCSLFVLLFLYPHCAGVHHATHTHCRLV